MNRTVRQLVRERAAFRCEYCLQSEDETLEHFLQVEHIIARKHDGTDSLDNLALACLNCNSHKGANLAGIDPESGALSRLFHPRQHNWHEHFEKIGLFIIGRTPVGRSTVQVLCLNSAERLLWRMALE
jgi:hypothetical protein